MNEKKIKRIEIRITEKDKYILKYLRKHFGSGTYDIIMNAVRDKYFVQVRQAENDYNLLKNEKMYGKCTAKN